MYFKQSLLSLVGWGSGSLSIFVSYLQRHVMEIFSSSQKHPALCNTLSSLGVRGTTSDHL